jgi:hypothetical protein
MDERKSVREKAETNDTAAAFGGTEAEDYVGRLAGFLMNWQLEAQEEGRVPDLCRDIFREAGGIRIPPVSERFSEWQEESYATALWLLRGEMKLTIPDSPEKVRAYIERLDEIRRTEPAVREGLIEFFDRESSNMICYRRFLPGGRDAEGEIMAMCNLGGRMEHVHTPYDIVSYTGMLGNYENRYDRKELRPFECLVLKHG